MFDFFFAVAFDLLHFGSIKPLGNTEPLPWHTHT